MTTPRNTKRQRLERAGWQHVAGWLPRDEAEAVQNMMRKHAPHAEQIGTTGQAHRGRPRGDEK